MIRVPPLNVSRVGGSRGMAALAGNSLPPLRLPVRNEGDKIGAGLADLGAGIAQGIRAKQARELEQQKMANLDKYRQGQLGLQKERIQEQKRQFDKSMAQEAKQLAAEESEQKMETAAYAALSWLRMPREDKIKNKDLFVNGLAQAGLMKEEDVEKAQQGDINTLDTLAKKTALLSTSAMKELAKDQKKDKDNQGTIKIYNEDGQLVYEKHPLTKSNINKTQEKIQKRKAGIQDVLNLRKQMKEKYLDYKGKYDFWISTKAEKAKRLPGIGVVADTIADYTTGMDNPERKQFVRKAQKFIGDTFLVFQKFRLEYTGVQAGYEELKEMQERFLSGKMSFSQYLGATDGILQRYRSELEQAQKDLDQGLLIKNEDGLYVKKDSQNQVQIQEQPPGQTQQQNQVQKVTPVVSSPGTIDVNATYKKMKDAGMNVTEEQIRQKAKSAGYEVN